MDPYAVLGLERGASSEEVGRAYRALARRLHPDRAGGSAELMAAVNAAYGQIAGVAALADERAAARGESPLPIAAAWLDPRQRALIAPELLALLEQGEAVRETAIASVTGSGDVQLLVTDRRLCWLVDDAVGGRTRSLRFRDVAAVRASSPRRPWRRSTLVVEGRGRRTIRFSGLSRTVVARLASAIDALAVRTLV